MMPRTLSLRLPAAGALLMAAAVVARAQLASNSPFLPPANAATPAATNQAPLQFAGYLDTPDGRQFRVHDPARKAGVFLKMNGRDEGMGVVVKSYDRDHNTLTIEHQGKTLTLQERESKIVSSGNAANMQAPVMPVPQPAPNVMPQVTQSVVVNPTPADEQKRLEAVAAEVARRRALREQATQQINQAGGQVNVAPVVAPPVQPQQGNFQPQQNNNNGGRGNRQPNARPVQR